ncbi:MAG: hypothetical protein JNL12_18960 [Planctomycetes bacterium]|nr:hypothetical protein [Planctomycetota bacterium]
MRPSRLFLCLALLGTGCGNGGGGSVVDPPESTIDMNGTWMVAALERRDSSGPLPTASPIGGPLFPVVVGQQLVIAGGIAEDGLGRLLFDDWGGETPERYTNVADGRTFRLDVATAWQTSCASTLAVRALFAPVDDDSMSGLLEVQYTSDCSPSFLDHEPNGVFLVRLERIFTPALGEAAGR